MTKKDDTTIVNQKSPTKDRGVFVWYGENQSFLGLEAQKWREQFSVKYPQAVLTRLDYDKAKENELAQQLHQAAWSSGMFVAERLIILTNFLKADSKGELAEEIKKLVNNLPFKIFLLLIESGKVTWSKGLPAVIDKLVKEEKIIKREFISLSSIELEKWIVAQAKLGGGNIPISTARVLLARVGDDMLCLTQEINKLISYRGFENVLATDVDLLVSGELSPEPFALAEAIARRDFKTAHYIIEYEFKNGAAPQQVVGLIAWQLRTLTNVRIAVGDSTTQIVTRDIANTLKLHPFVVTKALQYLPYYSLARLKELYGMLSDLDIKLKTSRAEPLVLFDLFLSNLVGGSR